MQKRAVRFTLLALLLVFGIAVAGFVWTAERRIATIETERQAVESTIERLLRAVGSIAAAQQAYVDYGQRDDASFARVSDLLDQIGTDASQLRTASEQPASIAALAEFDTALLSVRDADGIAKNSLIAGESLAAADALLDAARGPVAAMDAAARAVRQAEASRFAAQRAATAQRSWMALGVVALVWLVGLALLAPLPVPAVRAEAGDVPVSGAVPEPVAPPAPVGAERTGVDLQATASLCAEISRLTDTASLPDILRRAATILDARGIVIWMGAGEELFAATAYGYDAPIIRRLRPIARGSENATAACWRTGEVRTVGADGSSHGAVVAPMAGAAGIVGVVAAEVRHGREDDAATRAVAAIIASQLANVLSAWPAASVADSTVNDASGTVAPESDRQAAAS